MKITVLSFRFVVSALALALITSVSLVWLDRGNYGLGTLHEIHAGLTYKTDGEVTETTGRRVVLLERPDGLFVLPELSEEQPALSKGKYKLSRNRKLLVPAE